MFSVQPLIATLAASSSDGKSAVEVIPWAAFLAGVVALAVAAWNQYQSRRDRRRDLYSEAYKAVVSWAEMYYRVCRRDPQKPYEVVAMFHELQESIDYHEGWIGIESAPLARAYRRFVTDVKRKCEPAIRAAWAAEPCDPKEGFTPPDGGEAIDISVEKEGFLGDVNDHLSLHPERRHKLGERYPEPHRSTT